MSNTKEIQRAAKGLSRIEGSKMTTTEASSTDSVLQFPRDMYLHTPIKSEKNKDGCPTEWWWHTGTLKSEQGDRTFGFEINAAAFYPNYVTEVMLTDVLNKKHYQQTAPTILPLEGWAESDPSKDWRVNLENVQMHAPKENPTQNMSVKASIVDGNTTVEFDLTLSQEGLPFIVWGTGVTSPPSPPTTATNNYYFSLTRLNATGTITITTDDVIESIKVTGQTWMDHEWGLFKNHGKSVKWILQDMQLNNGVSISNFSLTTKDNIPKLNVQTNGKATVQMSGMSNSVCVDTLLTPKKSWTSSKGREYFTEIEVVIPEYDATFVVKTLMDNQLFTTFSNLAPIYEGAGTVSGSMKINSKTQPVDGTAWIEQTS